MDTEVVKLPSVASVVAVHPVKSLAHASQLDAFKAFAVEVVFQIEVFTHKWLACGTRSNSDELGVNQRV